MTYSNSGLPFTGKVSGANPSYSGVNNSAPINGSAQGMPAAKQFGSYTPGPNTNSLGSWGGATESSGIPGDPYSPVGAPARNGGYGGGGASGSGGNSYRSRPNKGIGIFNPGYKSQTKQIQQPAPLPGSGWYTSPEYQLGRRAQNQLTNAENSGNQYRIQKIEKTFNPGYTIGSMNPSDAPMAAARGGPIPSIAHTSKKVKGYDDGGSVSDNNSDDQASGAQDDSDTASGSTDSTAGADSAQGSGEQSDSDTLMASVYKTLDYGRQKYGISNDLINEVYPQSSFASGADQMRPSTNVEDDRQGGGSIDTSLPTTKADANQVLPNINGHSAGPTPPWPYNGSGQVLTALPPSMKRGGRVPSLDAGGAMGVGGGYGASQYGNKSGAYAPSMAAGDAMGVGGQGTRASNSSWGDNSTGQGWGSGAFRTNHPTWSANHPENQTPVAKGWGSYTNPLGGGKYGIPTPPKTPGIYSVPNTTVYDPNGAPPGYEKNSGFGINGQGAPNTYVPIGSPQWE